MKRNEIVTRLMAEGFSSKTLLKMDDKQLGLLSSRIINEQVEKETTMISKKSPTFNQDLENAKKANKTIETYEQVETDCTECEKTEMKEEKPSAGLTKKEKSDVVKKAKKGEDIGKKGKGFEKVSKKASKEYGSAEIGKKVAAAAMWKNLKEGDEINNWVDGLVVENYHSTSKGEIMTAIKQKLNEQQLEKSKLPLDTTDTVYADAVSMDQATAQKIANSNARAKFMGKFPNKHFLKIVETAHKTEDGDYRYVVGLKLKEEPSQQQQSDNVAQNTAVQNSTQPQGEIKEQDTLTAKQKVNQIPEWLKFDAIKSNGASPSIAPVKTPAKTMPGEKPRPKNPYQPGPGINPSPKAKF